MNFNVLAVFLVASLAGYSNAILIGRFGRFGVGLRPFGFNRFGLGFPVPIPVPVPVPVPVAAPIPVPVLGPFIGKRSVKNMTAVAEPMTTCNLSTEDLEMNCKGVNYNFKCKVENKLNMGHMEHGMETLRIIPANFNRMKNETINEAVLLSFKPKDEMRFNNFSVTHKSKALTFKIFYRKDNESQGFRVIDKACWEKFQKMMNDEDQVEMKLKLKF